MDTYCGKGLGDRIDYDTTLQKVRSRTIKNNPPLHGAIETVLVGGFWPGTRIRDDRRGDDDPVCQRCGEEKLLLRERGGEETPSCARRGGGRQPPPAPKGVEETPSCAKGGGPNPTLPT